MPMPNAHPVYKKHREEKLKYYLSKVQTDRQKDCIKFLWGRKPKPYGFKLYKETTTIYFD